MKNLLNPKWLFIINTLPISILFVLSFNQFFTIKPLLSDVNIQKWEFYGLILGILAILNFVYILFLVINKKKVSVWYGVIALISYITFLYFYLYNSSDIVPFNIPQWMVSDDISIYVGTFLMPTICYALFILVVKLTPDVENKSGWVDFSIVLSIPLLGYLFAVGIFPLWQNVESNFNIHFTLIFFISITLVFLFFIVRFIYILVSYKINVIKKYQLAWKIPIAIIFPIIGLMINNGVIFNHFLINDTGFFGNFNNSWFYIIAIVNGILICLPNLDLKTYRLFLFIARCITFSYTLYFFIVMLPFLPLSLIAIIALGVGFLMLTPLMLFVIHINELSLDYAYLKTKYSKRIVIYASILSFFAIPSVLTMIYLRDKIVLNKTLEYLYAPDYSRNYNINKESLASTLDVIKHHKNKSNMDFDEDNKIPFISSYYNWLVLDNLTLSDAKIEYIERIFFGDDSHSKLFNNQNVINNSNITNDIEVTKITSKSVYDKSQNAWRSWVDLTLKNNDNSNRQGEFATKIKLPEGCWISDYYLYVGSKKEAGILAEKKTAMWVFSNIKNERKDPGILYYLTGNDVMWRIFPFAKNEVRKTGIEFLHKEPIQLTIADNIVELGTKESEKTQNFENKNAAYISPAQKQFLRKVYRKPYFHFLVDVSKEKKTFTNNFIAQIQNTLKNNAELAKNAKISFVNTYNKTMSLNSNWKEQYRSQNFEGGYFLDRAIRSELSKSYNNNSYPVFVTVTSNINDAVLDKDFADFQFTFPESKLFYNLVNNKLEAHSLITNPLKPLADSCKTSFQKTVLEYKLDNNTIAYLPDDDYPSIILKKEEFNISDDEMKEKNWQSALIMHAKWNSLILHPEKVEKEWTELVKFSFMSKIMTPVTSYLVVENEAQKNVLKKKQEQVLSGKKSLDINEDTPRMSEPSLWFMVVIIMLLFWFQRKKDNSSLKV